MATLIIQYIISLIKEHKLISMLVVVMIVHFLFVLLLIIALIQLFTC